MVQEKDWGEAKFLRINTELYHEFEKAYVHFGYSGFSSIIRKLIKLTIIEYHKENNVNLYDVSRTLRTELYGAKIPRIDTSNIYAVSND